MNSQISAILALGADAMDNLFDVYITLPTAIQLPGGVQTARDVLEQKTLRLRVAGFEPPVFKTKTYDVKYKTVSVKRPAAVIEGAREFKLTFRLDAYYDVYLALAKWRNTLYTPASGFASNQVGKGTAADFGTVEVVALRGAVFQASNNSYQDALGIAAEGSDVRTSTLAANQLRYGYKHVWLTDLDEPKFKTGSGEVQSITASFQFGEFTDPSVDSTGESTGSPAALVPGSTPV
jgi:hypothetical protein